MMSRKSWIYFVMSISLVFILLSIPVHSLATSFVDGTVMQETASISTTCATPTHLLNISPGMPAGDNLFIISVQINSSDTTTEMISPGGLILQKDTTTIKTNDLPMLVGVAGTTTTYNMLALDAGAAAGAQYNLTACANETTIQAEAKAIIINNLKNVNITETATNVRATTSKTLINTLTTTSFPAGNNIVLAAVKVNSDNDTASNTISPGGITLERSGTTIDSNAYALIINAANGTAANYGFLLMGQDIGAPANAEYNVTVTTNTSAVQVESSILAISRNFTFIEGGDTAIGTGSNTLVTLTPILGSGTTVAVIASTDFDDTDSITETLTADTGYTLRNNDNILSDNDLRLRGVAASGSAGDGFEHSLLWSTNLTSNNLNLSVNVTPSGSGLKGQARLLVLDLDTLPPSFSGNSTNNTFSVQNTSMQFNITATANINYLSSCIFSWDNGTGTFVNDSAVALSGASAVCSHNKTIQRAAGTTMQWKWYANDSSNNNWNVSDTYSIITSVNNTPLSASNITNNTVPEINQLVQFNITWTDDVALSSCIFSWDNGTGTFVNDSTIILSSTTAICSSNKTIQRAAGTLMTWKWFANDSSGNWNQTSNFSVSVVDVAPTFSANATNNTAPKINQAMQFNITWTDGMALSSCIFSWDNGTGTFVNDSAVVLSGTSAICSNNKTIQRVQGTLMTWKWFANDSSGNWNQSVAYNIVVADTTPTINPSRIFSSTNTTTSPLLGFCNASDPDGGMVTYFFEWYKNDTWNRSSHNINPTSSPTQIGSISNISLDGTTGVYISNNLAYITSQNNDSLTIINVTDPTTPTQIGSISNISLDGATGVYISNNLAYVASFGNDSLTIINVTDPTTPIQVGSISKISLDFASGVYISNNLAYVASSSNDSLTIINVTDPTTPIQVGSISNGSLDSAQNVYISNNMAYVASVLNTSLTIINVTDPTTPTQIGSISNSSIQGATGVYISNNLAYVASQTNSSLTIINVTDPTTPIQVGSISNGSLNTSKYVYISNNLAYVASQTNSSLTIINVTDPTTPTQIGSISNESLNGSNRVYISNNLAYITSTFNDSLTIINISQGFPQSVETHISTIPSGDLTANDNWTLTCVGFDSTLNSSAINSTDLTVSTADTTGPTFSANATNNTAPKINQAMQFNITWTDGMALSSCIFSWDNGTGTFVNDSAVVLSGTSAICSNNKTIQRVQGTLMTWKWFANDSSGNWNQTSNFSVSVSDTTPTTPTLINPANNSNFSATPILLNYSSSDSDADTITYFIYINGTLNGSSTGNWSFNASASTYTWRIMASTTLTNSSNSTLQQFTLLSDVTAPTFSANATNNTAPKINQNINFSINWTDETALAYVVFQWDNGTGTFVNDSAQVLSGTAQAINVTKTIQRAQGTTMQWRWSANDTAGNWNNTPIYSVAVADTAPTAPTVTAVTPATAYANDTLISGASGSTDADADAIYYYIKWNTSAGVTLRDFTNASGFDSFNCATDQNCNKSVTIFAFAKAVTLVSGTTNSTEASQSKAITNYIPNITAPTLNNTSPYTDDTLLCSNGTYYDADSEDIATWYYQWYDSGTIISGQASSTLALTTSGLNRGDTILCETRASDGTSNSTYKNSSSVTILDTATTFTSNSTNDTNPKIYEAVNFSITITDADTLSHRIFSYDNGTGTFTNDSAVLISGTSFNANVTKTIERANGTTLQWQWFANDTTGNWNSSGTFSVKVGDTSHVVTLNEPADAEHLKINTSIPFNFTVSDADNASGANYQCDIMYNSTGSTPNLKIGLNATVQAGNKTTILSNNTLADGRYAWIATCTSTGGTYINSSTRTIVIDPDMPDITWNYPALGSTTKLNSTTLNLNIQCADTNLERVNLTMKNNATGTIIYSNLSTNLSSSPYVQSASLNMGTNTSGNYTIEFSCADDVSGSPKIDDKLTSRKDTTDKTKAIEDTFIFNDTKQDLMIIASLEKPTKEKEIKSNDLILTSSFVNSGTKLKFGLSFTVPSDGVVLVLDLTSNKSITDRSFASGRTAHFIWGDYYTDFNDVNQSIMNITTKRISDTHVQVRIGGKTQWLKNQFIDIDPVTGGLNTQTETTNFLLDLIPPYFTSNSTNDTTPKMNEVINFSITITDVSSNVAGYIFSYDNGTGTFVNDSFIAITGSNVTVGVTKTIQRASGTTIQWKWHANDTVSLFNVSNTYQLTVQDTAGTFTSNTTNNTVPIQNQTVQFNITITDADTLASFIFSWDNGTDILVNDSARNLSGTSAAVSVNKTIQRTNGTTMTWKWYANDTAGNMNQSGNFSLTVALESDVTPPTVTLKSPANASDDSDGTVTFVYNISDSSAISNCSLFYSTGDTFTIKNVDTTITNNANNSFDIAGIPNGRIFWLVQCADNSSNFANSSRFNLTITISSSGTTTGSSGSGDTGTTDQNLESTAVESTRTDTTSFLRPELQLHINTSLIKKVFPDLKANIKDNGICEIGEDPIFVDGKDCKFELHNFVKGQVFRMAWVSRYIVASILIVGFGPSLFKRKIK